VKAAGLGRLIRDARYRVFYALLLRSRSGMVTLGARPCQWTVDLTGLGPDSIVYSAGAGRDITFERELIVRTGCRVWLLDPTPTGIATVRDARLPDAGRLAHLSLALSDRVGSVRLVLREDSADGSYSMASDGEADSGVERIEAEGTTLGALMRRLGHARIDLLKMDIEGAEYGVLADLCLHRLPVRQIAVEFHHWMIPSLSRRQTVAAVLRLRSAGYRLVHVHGWDHTFVTRKRARAS